MNEKNKIYRQNHKNEIKEYYQIHKDQINIYRKKRSKIDEKFKLNRNISCLINHSLKGNKNGHHWEQLVDYTLNDLKKHLEKQFTNGMTWENYGEWHIDHRIPISAFNFKTFNDIDFKRCWALSNIQPLWAKENMRKNDKIDCTFQPSLTLGM